MTNLYKVHTLTNKTLDLLPPQLWLIIDKYCKPPNFIQCQRHLSERFVRYNPFYNTPKKLRRSPRFNKVVIPTNRSMWWITLDKKRIYYNSGNVIIKPMRRRLNHRLSFELMLSYRRRHR